MCTFSTDDPLESDRYNSVNQLSLCTLTTDDQSMPARRKRERAVSVNILMPKRTKRADNLATDAHMDDAINAVASSQSQASIGDGDGVDVDVGDPAEQRSTTVERLSKELGEL